MNMSDLAPWLSGLGVIFTIIIGVIGHLRQRASDARAEERASGTVDKALALMEARLEKADAVHQERTSALSGRVVAVESAIASIPQLDKGLAVLAKEFDGFKRQVETKVDEANHNSRNIRTGQDQLQRMLQDILVRQHQGG